MKFTWKERRLFTKKEMFELGGDTVNFRNDIWLNYKRGFLKILD